MMLQTIKDYMTNNGYRKHENLIVEKENGDSMKELFSGKYKELPAIYQNSKVLGWVLAVKDTQPYICFQIS